MFSIFFFFFSFFFFNFVVSGIIITTMGGYILHIALHCIALHFFFLSFPCHEYDNMILFFASVLTFGWDFEVFFWRDLKICVARVYYVDIIFFLFACMLASSHLPTYRKKLRHNKPISLEV
jgi:hypothetical protein